MKFFKVRPLKSGWTRWQKPKMKGYLMQCCDCGLIHEVDFRVYKIIKRYPDGTMDVEIAGDEYEVGLRMKRFEGKKGEGE